MVYKIIHFFLKQHLPLLVGLRYHYKYTLVLYVLNKYKPWFNISFDKWTVFVAVKKKIQPQTHSCHYLTMLHWHSYFCFRWRPMLLNYTFHYCFAPQPLIKSLISFGETFFCLSYHTDSRLLKDHSTLRCLWKLTRPLKLTLGETCLPSLAHCTTLSSTYKYILIQRAYCNFLD